MDLQEAADGFVAALVHLFPEPGGFGKCPRVAQGEGFLLRQVIGVDGNVIFFQLRAEGWSQAGRKDEAGEVRGKEPASGDGLVVDFGGGSAGVEKGPDFFGDVVIGGLQVIVFFRVFLLVVNRVRVIEEAFADQGIPDVFMRNIPPPISYQKMLEGAGLEVAGAEQGFELVFQLPGGGFRFVAVKLEGEVVRAQGFLQAGEFGGVGLGGHDDGKGCAIRAVVVEHFVRGHVMRQEGLQVLGFHVGVQVFPVPFPEVSVFVIEPGDFFRTVFVPFPWVAVFGDFFRHLARPGVASPDACAGGFGRVDAVRVQDAGDFRIIGGAGVEVRNLDGGVGHAAEFQDMAHFFFRQGVDGDMGTVQGKADLPPGVEFPGRLAPEGGEGCFQVTGGG